MATFSIGLTKNIDESILTVRDITTYPQTVNTVSMAQEKICRIMLYSTDSFVANFNSDFANPGSDSLTSEWQFATTVDTLYSIAIYYGIVWDAVTVDCDSNAIVFYDGYFWINTGVATKDSGVDPAPPDDSDWARLYIGATVDLTAIGGASYAAITEAEMRTILEASYAGSVLTNASTDLEQTSGDPFTLEKTACHTWTLTERRTPTSITVIELLTFDYVVIDDTITMSGESAIISLDSDGAYIVKITYVSGGETLYSYLVIEDFCDAEDCYMQLLQYIACHCEDPCEGCNDDYATRKYDLDMIGHLLFQIKQYVYLEKFQYIGIMSMEDTRQDLVDTISLMIEKLSIIIDRCGLCDEDDTNTV